MTQYQETLQGMSIDGLRFERAESVRRHTHSVEVGFKLPAIQAFFTGFLVTGFVGVVWFGVGWPNPFAVVGGTFFLSSLVMWIVRLIDWTSLVHKLEEELNVDMNRDNHIGAPAPEFKVNVVHKKENSTQQKFLHFAGKDVDVLSWLDALLDGEDTSERDWTGRGKPFSQNQFRYNRDLLIDNGYAMWRDENNHNQGFVLTEGGRVVIENMMKQDKYGEYA